MKKLYVDRIVEGIVVCEDDDFNRTEIKISEINFDIHEGSVLAVDDDGIISPDESEEEKRRKEIIELQNKLMNS